MKISNPKEFGEAIRKKRKALSYTQSFLADITGLSVSFISDLERGKSTAELGKALFLSNVLGLDVQIISRGSDL